MLKHSWGLLACSVIALAAQPGTIPSTVTAEFATRIQRYMSMRQEPAPAVAGADRAAPRAVVERRAKLAERIRTARKDAKPGDVLFPELVTAITPIFRSDSFSISGRQASAMGRDTDRPPDNVAPPRVNQEFPKSYGLVSPPATILVKLPELPDALEYRLIGPHLVLRDVDANLIVDVAPNVLSAR